MRREWPEIHENSGNSLLILSCRLFKVLINLPINLPIDALVTAKHSFRTLSARAWPRGAAQTSDWQKQAGAG